MQRLFLLDVLLIRGLGLIRRFEASIATYTQNGKSCKKTLYNKTAFASDNFVKLIVESKCIKDRLTFS